MIKRVYLNSDSSASVEADGYAPNSLDGSHLGPMLFNLNEAIKQAFNGSLIVN